MAELESLRDYRKNTSSSFLTAFSLLIAFTSCNDSARQAPEAAVSDSITPTALQEDVPIRAEVAATGLRKDIAIRMGDFDTMLKHHVIRVLVPYSRTLFFNDKGKERGLTADYVREFERFLNQKYHRQLNNVPITVAIVPTPRDQLIAGVVEGRGELAAGNLTVTDERLRQVDFFALKDWQSVSEVVLTRKRDGPLYHVEQLSGKTIHVRRSSSYYESLRKINSTLAAKGRPPARLTIVSENLEDEDLMEMLDAGIIAVIVVDDWKAKMWAQILPDIIVNEKVAIRSGGHIGWLFRKNSPLLTAELKDFYHNFAKRLGFIQYRFKQYNRQVESLQDPTKTNNWKRYQQIMQLFEKYGGKYDFDPLMLAAIGFQESKLDQGARSAVGAIGIMQVMPSTGAAMRVGDITVTEPNIHAATKYMEMLRTRHFRDARFDDFNKSLFAFASYNAGPARVAGLRKVAVERGLNPDVWLNSVEIVASEEIGRETTTHVRNVIKYYYSYKLMLELIEEQRRHREAF